MTMKSAADDGATSVADAAKIVTSIEGWLTASRAELADIERERRAVAFAAFGLDDSEAIDRLAVLANDEAATRQSIADIALALEVGQSKLAAAKAAELVERRPRYVSERTRRIGGLSIEPGAEFELLSWPDAKTDIPCNPPADRVQKYYAANCANPKLPESPWHEAAACLHLPDLPPFKARPTWKDPRPAWRSSDSSPSLDALFREGVVAAVPQPPAAAPRRPAGAQRRV